MPGLLGKLSAIILNWNLFKYLFLNLTFYIYLAVWWFVKEGFLLELWTLEVGIIDSLHFFDYGHGWHCFTIYLYGYCSSVQVRYKKIADAPAKQIQSIVGWTACVVFWATLSPMVPLTMLFSKCNWRGSQSFWEECDGAPQRSWTDISKCMFYDCLVAITAFTLHEMKDKMNNT